MRITHILHSKTTKPWSRNVMDVSEGIGVIAKGDPLGDHVNTLENLFFQTVFYAVAGERACSGFIVYSSHRHRC